MQTMPTLARAIAFALAAGTGAAHAVQLDYTVSAGIGHSDNLNESQTAPVGSTELIPRLDFSLKEEGAEVVARANGEIEYRDYLDGHFDNQVRGQLATVVNWSLSPRRLVFDFEDYASVQPVDILASNTPNNQQQTNVFTLGPTLNLRFDPTWYGQADLRVSDSTASVSREFDSVRVLGALRALKELNATDQLSGNVEDQNVHFTNSVGGPDYDRYSAYGRYQSKLASLDLDLSLGYSWLNFSTSSQFPNMQDVSGALARGSVNWHPTAQSTFTAGFARQYSDAAENLVVDPSALVLNPVGGEVTFGAAPVTSEVYLERRVNVGYVYRAERWALSLAPYWRTLDYPIDTLQDQHAHGAVFGASYRLLPLWTLAFDANEETRSYTSLVRRDEDLRLDLSLVDQLSRHLSVRLDLIRNQRNSTALNQGFRENIVFLTFVFHR